VWNVDKPLPVDSIEVLDMLNRIFGTTDPSDTVKFIDAYQVKELPSVEHEIMFAVIEQSFYDWKDVIEKDDSPKITELIDWYFNCQRDNKHWITSFENICLIFNWEPNYIRRLIIQWTQRNYKRRNDVPSDKRSLLGNGTPTH
jgi:hypothetical protein